MSSDNNNIICGYTYNSILVVPMLLEKDDGGGGTVTAVEVEMLLRFPMESRGFILL